MGEKDNKNDTNIGIVKNQVKNNQISFSKIINDVTKNENNNNQKQIVEAPKLNIQESIVVK